MNSYVYLYNHSQIKCNLKQNLREYGESDNCHIVLKSILFCEFGNKLQSPRKLYQLKWVPRRENLVKVKKS